MQAYSIQKQDEQTTVLPSKHEHTLIFIHGLAQDPETFLDRVIKSLGFHIARVKIVLPKAPKRHVTIMGKEVASWFDIKYRGKESFTDLFDKAFSESEVLDSFSRFLEPVIKSERRILDLNNSEGKLVVAGFSQGCGMSLHCLYHSKLVDHALGIAGYSFGYSILTEFRYLFPITHFDSSRKAQKMIIHGLNDSLRPWEHVKVTYEGKVSDKQIVLVEGMDHNIDPNTVKEMQKFFNVIFS